MELKGEPARQWKAFRKREKVAFAGSKDDKGGQDDSDDRIGSAGSSVGSHWANLVDAIRSGKDEDLNCDIIEGHYSCALPHLANISYRLGRELKFMGENEKFVNDPEADAMLTRLYRKPYVVPGNV